MDTTIHENICHNIATDKSTLHEKEFSLIPEGEKFADVPQSNVPVLSPNTRLHVSHDTSLSDLTYYHIDVVKPRGFKISKINMITLVN